MQYMFSLDSKCLHLIVIITLIMAADYKQTLIPTFNFKAKCAVITLTLLHCQLRISFCTFLNLRIERLPDIWSVHMICVKHAFTNNIYSF